MKDGGRPAALRPTVPVPPKLSNRATKEARRNAKALGITIPAQATKALGITIPAQATPQATQQVPPAAAAALLVAPAPTVNVETIEDAIPAARVRLAVAEGTLLTVVGVGAGVCGCPRECVCGGGGQGERGRALALCTVCV